MQVSVEKFNLHSFLSNSSLWFINLFLINGLFLPAQRVLIVLMVFFFLFFFLLQSDLNQGGVFSVLYGHNVNRTNATASSNWQTLKSDFSPEATLRLVDPKMEWNAV